MSIRARRAPGRRSRIEDCRGFISSQRGMRSVSLQSPSVLPIYNFVSSFSPIFLPRVFLLSFKSLFLVRPHAPAGYRSPTSLLSNPCHFVLNFSHTLRWAAGGISIPALSLALFSMTYLRLSCRNVRSSVLFCTAIFSSLGGPSGMVFYWRIVGEMF